MIISTPGIIRGFFAASPVERNTADIRFNFTPELHSAIHSRIYPAAIHHSNCLKLRSSSKPAWQPLRTTTTLRLFISWSLAGYQSKHKRMLSRKQPLPLAVARNMTNVCLPTTGPGHSRQPTTISWTLACEWLYSPPGLGTSGHWSSQW